MTEAYTDAEDRAWADAWIRYSRGDWGSDGKGNPHPPGNLLWRLERVRKHRPRACVWLTLYEPRAAALAARAGWDDPHTGERTPEEIAHVEAVVAKLTPAREPASDRPHHLTTEQLNAINPGRKR
jgi:hypothetical protein